MGFPRDSAAADTCRRLDKSAQVNSLMSSQSKILHVVGARPNFMKATPVLRALEAAGFSSQVLVHTGQHYDANMSEVFFRQLGLSEPDVSLNVGSGSHAEQTAQVMVRFEKAVLDQSPDLVLVYGDVNSTVAAALVCAKMGIPVGHVEAGLRSYDRGMPEEINRLLTDQISSLLFTPSEDADHNLLREGVAQQKIYLVGNVMIDTLVRLLPAAHQLWPDTRTAMGLTDAGFGLVTLHRPSNVDDPDSLRRILSTLSEISEELPLVFPMHPRTFLRIREEGLQDLAAGLTIIDPVGYVEFLALQENAAVVLTDSGGIQEETTYLKVPCITLRCNTERPVTVSIGTNVLVGQDMEMLRRELRRIMDGDAGTGQVPPLWDGQAAVRIADVVRSAGY